LNSKIRNEGNNAGEELVELAVSQAQTWVKLLPLRPEVSRRAERAAAIPWLRFRSEVLKKIGVRPIASL
jgi:hypothetical protein